MKMEEEKITNFHYSTKMITGKWLHTDYTTQTALQYSINTITLDAITLTTTILYIHK